MIAVVEICLTYHRNHSKKNTTRAYELTLSKFCMEFGDREMDEVSSNETLIFLNRITDGRKLQTKHTRFSHLNAFFNFIRNNIDHECQ